VLQVGKGKVLSWASLKDDAIKRESFVQRSVSFLDGLPDTEQQKLDRLSSEPRNDAKGEMPGSERADEERRLFLDSLSTDDRSFLEGHEGLGNSQKAEVAWLEKCGYDYEEKCVVRDGFIPPKKKKPSQGFASLSSTGSRPSSTGSSRPPLFSYSGKSSARSGSARQSDSMSPRPSGEIPRPSSISSQGT
jgi:hypothetical protein